MSDALLDLLELGIVHLDGELRVDRVNATAARWLGVDARAAAGRSLIELFLDHRLEQAARRALAEGSASIETSLHRDGERLVNVRIHRDGDSRMWLVIVDVTELRRLQRIRSEFVDNLSHELRTPLTTIRLLTETLLGELERADGPPRIRERVEKIDTETGHLAQMVGELLDLSRIEAGAAELRRAPADVAALASAAIERARTFAERHSIRLETDVPADLPQAWADAERIGQVLVNLLHNAVKFSPPGTAVTLAAREIDEELRIEVRDQGIGIARDDLARVFERFYKADRARQRGVGGTGLGLAIARHIVEGHGGRIWVDSVEGHGATFAFTLPRSS